MAAENGTMRRRQVLGGLTLLPARTVRGSQANSRLRLGVIGAGDRGAYDARLAVESGLAEVAALCDIFDDSIEKARAAIPGAAAARVYRDHRALLEDPGIDAVIIATPIHLHPEHLEAAVAARKHIYIEKPAAVDVAGVKRVMRAADALDRRFTLVFGFQQRYGSGYHKARRLIAGGGIGKLQAAHAHVIRGGLYTGRDPVTPRDERERIRTWKTRRDTFGDYVVENYVHNIDVFNWFIGRRPAAAVGSGAQTVIRIPGVRDQSNLTFEYGPGLIATLTGAQVAPGFHRDVHESFYGSEGIVETAREWWRHHRAKGDVAEEKERRDITADAIEDFLKRVRDGRPENTGARGAESTLTAILGRMAIDRSGRVTWEEMYGAA